MSCTRADEGTIHAKPPEAGTDHSSSADAATAAAMDAMRHHDVAVTAYLEDMMVTPEQRRPER